MNNFQSSCNDELVMVIELILKSHPDRARLILKLERVALELGKPSQPSISKVTAGRLITILAGIAGKALKNELVDILKRVFTNTEVEARKIGILEIFPRLLEAMEL